MPFFLERVYRKTRNREPEKKIVGRSSVNESGKSTRASKRAGRGGRTILKKISKGEKKMVLETRNSKDKGLGRDFFLEKSQLQKQTDQGGNEFGR